MALFLLLTAAMLAVSTDGPLTTILPSIITALAVAVAVWALVVTRRQRHVHEARLTAWAAEQAAQTERLDERSVMRPSGAAEA